MKRACFYKNKKFLWIPMSILFTFSACETNPGVSEAFTKYRYRKGVTTITVPGWVIGMAARWGDLEKEERQLLKSIDQVKVLSIEDDDLNARTNLHKAFFETVRERRDLEELMVVREHDAQLTIFGKINGEAIEEMVILVGGDENALVYLKGNLHASLINQMVKGDSRKKFLSSVPGS